MIDLPPALPAVPRGAADLLLLRCPGQRCQGLRDLARGSSVPEVDGAPGPAGVHGRPGARGRRRRLDQRGAPDPGCLPPGLAVHPAGLRP